MSSPWDVLGLDPATVDAASLRRAYATLVKRHRPDKDPGRFQEIREAYEQAQRLLAHRDATGAPLEELEVFDVEGSRVIGRRWTPELEESEEEPCDPVRPEPEAPEAAGIVEAFATARRAGDEVEMARILAAARPYWIGAPEQQAWFLGLVVEAPELYAAAVGDEAAGRDAVLAARHDAVFLANALLALWAAGGAWTAVTRVADRLLEATDASADSGVGVALAQAACARALALGDPPRARRLVDEAYQRLPPELRDAMLHEAEVRLCMADELRELEDADRQRLAQVLAAGVSDPRSEAFLAVYNALHAVPRESVTWAVLGERHPGTARAVRKSQRVAGEQAEKGARRDRRSNTWRFMLLAFVVLNVGRLAMNQLDHDREATRTPAPEPARVEEALRRLDEVLPGTRGGDPVRDVFGRVQLPPVYDRYPWLLPIRRDMESGHGVSPVVAEALLRGAGGISPSDARYPVMLRVLRDDDTLPVWLRVRCEELLRGLPAGLGRPR